MLAILLEHTVVQLYAESNRSNNEITEFPRSLVHYNFVGLYEIKRARILGHTGTPLPEKYCRFPKKITISFPDNFHILL